MTPTERARLWRINNSERAKALYRSSRLKRVFGLTTEQYDELLLKQEGKCAVCQRHESEFNRRLAIDHCHKTGYIRGLLCNFCNRRLIGRHSDPDRFERAAAYLRQNTGWIVPPKKKKKKKKRARLERTISRSRLSKRSIRRRAKKSKEAED